MLKGTMVSVEGRIQTSNYTDKKGNKVYSTDIIVERIQILKKTQNTPQNENKRVINEYQDMSIKTESDLGEQLKITEDDYPF
jgi:single-strand DNA-binding protein